jgi:peptide/nickel transport system permease protein
VFRYLIRRILWACLLFVVITFITFVIFYVGPNNPARAVCGGEQAKRECLVRATAKLGLDQPMPVQYFKFMKQLVLHQDLGTSFATSQSVNQRIKEAAPVTASLVFGGAVLWMILGLSIGIFSALKPRSLVDRFAMVFVLIGVSAHPVWIGLILEYTFGVKLGWTPIAGYANFFGAASDSGQAGGPWQWFYHMILPWCTFALLFAAAHGARRVVRADVEDHERHERDHEEEERGPENSSDEVSEHGVCPPETSGAYRRGSGLYWLKGT